MKLNICRAALLLIVAMALPFALVPSQAQHGHPPPGKGYGIFRPQPVDSVTWPVSEIPPQPKPTQYIVAHLALQLFNQEGPATLTANCGPGEQMMGGGFKIDASNTFVMPGHVNRWSASNLGNFPSGPSSWSGSYIVTDYKAHKHPSDPDPNVAPIDHVDENQLTAFVTVYCLTGTDLPLGITQVSGANSSGGAGYFSSFATCPPNSVVTGGGFQMNPTGPDLTLLSTNPTVGADSIANGWGARAWGIGDLTAYALCAQSNLQAIAAPVAVTDQTNALLGAAAEHDLTGTCPDNGVTTGGGFNIVGWGYTDTVVPPGSGFFDSLGSVGLNSWTARVMASFQTTQYTMEPCFQNTDCVDTGVVLACFKMPDIPRIYVSIVQPKNGTHYDIAAVTGTRDWTDEIVLAAVATDEQGNVIPDAAISWDYLTGGSGHIGDGRVLKGRMETGQSIVDLTIRATATWHGLSAFDNVTISTGTVH